MRFPSLLVASLVLVAKLAPTVRGDCYTSSSDILTAQLNGEKEITICPNTTITVGIPVDAAFTQFVGGDLPLIALGDDVTIKCGDDGSSSNYCAMVGGLIQFATTPAIAQAPNLPIITTNNLLVQGLTFTGELVSVPGAGDIAVLLSTAGNNMVFQDCIFANMVASSVFGINNNALVPPEAFPPGIVTVTVKDSVFDEITYTAVMAAVRNQTLAFDNVRFSNIYYNPPEDSEDSTDMILYASGQGDFSITNCDFTNVEFKNSIAFIRGNEMTYSVSGNTGSNWKQYQGVNETKGCTKGLIVALSDAGKLDLSTDKDTCLALTEEPVETVEMGTMDEETVDVDGGDEDESGSDGNDEGGSAGSMASSVKLNMAAMVSAVVFGAISYAWI